jgi:hypothetical protein
MSSFDKVPLSVGEILADWNPRDEIREGSRAHINEELLTIEIDTGHCDHTYQVDLERCNTPGQMLDWIFQVKSKTWATPEIMFDFLTALEVSCQIFHGKGVQGSLCPFGTSRQIKWGGK